MKTTKKIKYSNNKFDFKNHHEFVTQTINAVIKTLLKEIVQIKDAKNRWIVVSRVVSFLYAGHFNLSYHVGENAKPPENKTK